MKVIDPGHLYELDTLDEVDGWAEEFRQLRFVKRIGDKFPGNDPPGYSGTTTQEVLRALVDRMMYVDRQIPDPRNKVVITHMLDAIRELEMRAAEKRGDHGAVVAIFTSVRPDLMPTCDTCGHVACREHA